MSLFLKTSSSVSRRKSYCSVHAVSDRLHTVHVKDQVLTHDGKADEADIGTVERKSRCPKIAISRGMSAIMS